MRLKSSLARVWAGFLARRYQKYSRQAVQLQEKTFQQLIRKGRKTAFGKDHQFDQIHSYEDFKKRVPVRNYEASRPWVDRIVKGEADVCWPGNPMYLAKTSGTTSGAKYIPITRESIRMQIKAARDSLLLYIAEKGNADFLDGKMMFLSGSPKIDQNEFGIKTGRLSGIVNHFVPGYLQRNKVPGYETNCIPDWEEKVSQIVRETIEEDLRLISGIPPWVQMFFEEVERQSGKAPLELWPNLQIFAQGGVDFQPYQPIFEKYFKGKVDITEVFPASEGFFAFQNSLKDDGLLLLPNFGIFFEFIPLSEYGTENARRLSLAEVEVGEQYALILSTNAGLWAYDIGDTVKFVSTNPYKLRVSGRVKHFISAFGEHVISEEVNTAMIEATEKSSIRIQEFTVAPFIREEKGASAHEWLVEFMDMPEDLQAFSQILDESVRRQNSYYNDLREGQILKMAEVVPIPLNAARNYMKSIGKLGGQNKFPRLSNDRKIAEALKEQVT